MFLFRMRSVGGSVNARMQQMLQLPLIKEYVVMVQEEEMVLIRQEEEVQPPVQEVQEVQEVQSVQEEVSQLLCTTASSNKYKYKNKKKQKRK